MSRDDASLLDMLVAAKDAVAFCQGVTWEEFAGDRMRRFAVARAVEIIGEAARNVSEEVRSSCPRVPWHDVVGTRHHLVHRYFDVDWAILWNIVHADLPDLIEALEPLVPQGARPQGGERPEP
jgi:uncharacterized protein with HEPN domain